jgi:hypothetical protein
MLWPDLLLRWLANLLLRHLGQKIKHPLNIISTILPSLLLGLLLGNLERNLTQPCKAIS